MATLRVLAEQIYRRMNGGDAPDENGLDMEDVKLSVAQAINYYIKTNLWDNMKEEGARIIDSFFISVYGDGDDPVEVKYNSARDKYYIDLPATPISLPRGMGLYEICPLQDEENAFIPLPSGFLSLYKDNPAAYLEGNIGYLQEGSRVILAVNFESHKKFIKRVLVKMIASIEDYGPDDKLPIPPDIEFQVVEEVFKRMMNRIPEDLKNDQKQD